VRGHHPRHPAQRDLPHTLLSPAPRERRRVQAGQAFEIPPARPCEDLQRERGIAGEVLALARDPVAVEVG
jgi:hypothetical protein